MQKTNEMVSEIKNYFSFENIRIVAICSLLGFMAGAALVMYYVKLTPLIFMGSSIYKTSMVSIGQKDFFPAEDASNLIIFSERGMLDVTDCESSINTGPSKASISAAVIDKKSGVIRIEARSTDSQTLKICLSTYMNQLSSYDQKAVLNYKMLQTTPTSNNSNLIRENSQVNVVLGGIIGEINIAKIPIRQYPINLFKLIFLFSLGGIFIGILICYCKSIFFDPS